MDYIDFYVESLEAGAQPDQFGNIVHTPASMATFAMNQQQEQHQAFDFRPPVEQGFWEWFFGN